MRRQSSLCLFFLLVQSKMGGRGNPSAHSHIQKKHLGYIQLVHDSAIQSIRLKQGLLAIGFTGDRVSLVVSILQLAIIRSIENSYPLLLF